jgi:hypothetical protein
MLMLLWIFFLISLPAAAEDLAGLKAKVMSADYRGDLAELAQLRDQISKRSDDGNLTYVARYWSGFASWRMAINGANAGMKSEDLKINLQNAASDMYAAARMKDDFADAWAAAALINGWLCTFSMQSDPVAFRERLSLSQTLYARAASLDPNNPRVLWAKGAFRLYNPKPDVAGAIEVYRQMLTEAEKLGVHALSPLPDWGKPEALMSLAFAQMQKKDLDSARANAKAALAIVPDWAYVKNNLLPLIEKK